MLDYGIRWSEFGRFGDLQVKEKFFNTEAARTKFVDKLVDKPSFYQTIAWADPK